MSAPSVLRVDSRTGVAPGPEAVIAALAAQRARLSELFAGLDDEQWQAASRCSAWTVHDVARHLVDVLTIDTARLLHGRPAFRSDVPFDPRTTPNEWLAASADVTPAETVAAFERLAADEQKALREAAATFGDQTITGPYGPIHWSAFMAHVFWDAWLHERDIASPLGLTPKVGAHEDRLAATYGLVVAAAVASLAGVQLDVTLALDGANPVLVRVATEEGAAAATIVDGVTPALRADLEVGLDALAGRGSAPESVFDGPADVLAPLTWLRGFLLPAD